MEAYSTFTIAKLTFMGAYWSPNQLWFEFFAVGHKARLWPKQVRQLASG